MPDNRKTYLVDVWGISNPYNLKVRATNEQEALYKVLGSRLYVLTIPPNEPVLPGIAVYNALKYQGNRIVESINLTITEVSPILDRYQHCRAKATEIRTLVGV